MNAERQRIAIAEACGWKWYRRPATGPWASKPMRSLYHPDLSAEYLAALELADMTERECNPAFMWREGMIPNYTGDLNACAQFEDALDYMNGERSQYLAHLTRIVAQYNDDKPSSKCRGTHRATAAQRAEAFLRTIGRWEEDK